MSNPYYKVGKVGFAGDWHGNTSWAETRIDLIVNELKDEDEKLIFHVGDFGFWPYRDFYYIEAVTRKLESVNAELFFVDGNHEHHVLLRKRAEQKNVLDKPEPVHITDRITWMQRGSRATISGKNWLFLGGAASVDRYRRTEGQSWFPEERITDDQVKLAIAGGPADLLVAHDSPACTPIKFPHSNWPEQDLALSQVNREKIQEVCDACGINYVVHGHMHMAFEQFVNSNGRGMRVNCLNCDGEYGNWAILDSESMEWVCGG